MNNLYFHIPYEFDIPTIGRRIDEQLLKDEATYIVVADGNILQMVHNDLDYRDVVNHSLFAICDSSWVPIFLNRIYKFKPQQYCGSQIFDDLTRKKCYRQFFIGTSERILEGLKNEISKIDPAIANMTFYAPPFCKVEDFDYPSIAAMVNAEAADIIWVALGAPKQEQFMQRLQPFLKRGVMIGVGAVFNFRSGLDDAPRRAPQWMVRCHLEWLYRIFAEPKKQGNKTKQFLKILPKIYKEEAQKSKQS